MAPLHVHKYVAILVDGADGYFSLPIEEALKLHRMLCNDALKTKYELFLPT